MSTGHHYLQSKGFLVACVSLRPRETLVSFLNLETSSAVMADKEEYESFGSS